MYRMYLKNNEKLLALSLLFATIAIHRDNEIDNKQEYGDKLPISFNVKAWKIIVENF